jgi:hypothetical protein
MRWIHLRFGLHAHLLQVLSERLSESFGGLLRLPHIDNAKAARSFSGSVNQEACDRPVRRRL